MAKKDNLNGVVFTTKLLAFIVAGIVLFISRYAFMFFILAMLPSISSVMFERKSNKYVSSIICAFNLTAVSPFLYTIFVSGGVNEAASQVIHDTYTWLIIYMAPAIGWCVILIVPHLVANIMIALTNSKIASNLEAQKNIVEEWGKEVLRRD